MQDFVYDDQGNRVATIKDGDLVNDAGVVVGTVRSRNVYDPNGKFVFHLQPVEGSATSGQMTVEAVGKLLHPKPPRSDR